MSLIDSNANRCANSEYLREFMKQEDARQREEDEFREAFHKAEAEIYASDRLFLDAITDLGDLLAHADMTDEKIKAQAARHPNLSSVASLTHKRDVALACLHEMRKLMAGKLSECYYPAIRSAIAVTAQYSIESRADDIVEAAEEARRAGLDFLED